jgi:hypothetical protein
MEFITILSTAKRLEHCQTLEEIIEVETQMMELVESLMKNDNVTDAVLWRVYAVMERHRAIIRKDFSTLCPEEEVNKILEIITGILRRRLNLEQALVEINRNRRLAFPILQ